MNLQSIRIYKILSNYINKVIRKQNFVNKKIEIDLHVRFSFYWYFLSAIDQKALLFLTSHSKGYSIINAIYLKLYQNPSIKLNFGYLFSKSLLPKN